MLDRWIEWDAVRSDNFPVIIKHHADAPRPSRKINVYQVPGRNGDVIEMQDAWNNYTQSYELFIMPNKANRDQSVQEIAREVAEWLNAPSGYSVLYDSFEPDVFRYAYFDGGMNIVNSLSRYGSATVNFICKPFRYLTSGIKAIEYSASGKIWNPTVFASRPLIYVNGATNGTVTIGNTVLTIKAGGIAYEDLLTDGTAWVDLAEELFARQPWLEDVGTAADFLDEAVQYRLGTSTEDKSGFITAFVNRTGQDTALVTSAANSASTIIRNYMSDRNAGDMYIDCENQECYRGQANMNKYVKSSTGEFPTLLKNENAVGFSGTVTSISITPNWVTL